MTKRQYAYGEGLTEDMTFCNVCAFHLAIPPMYVDDTEECEFCERTLKPKPVRKPMFRWLRSLAT